MVEIVAEVSGNHDGSMEKMLRLIYEAADGANHGMDGCDYVKFQYYRPEDMPDCHDGDNLEMYCKLAVPDHWLPMMFAAAKTLKIGLFASVFSDMAAKELLKYDVPYIKIASPESTRLPMETYKEIVRAIPRHIGLLVSSGLKDWSAMTVLDGLRIQCPPGHPPSDRDIWEYLRLYDRDYHYGFSDHTSGIQVPLAFIRRGARMIEKHFKLEGDVCCVDANFSADPATMRQLCKLARSA